MVVGRMTPADMVSGAFKYLRNRIKRRPVLVNLEVTKRCMARCDFCKYWQEERVEELSDYRPILRVVKPVIVSLTGGEPMLRKDIYGICKDIKEMPGYTYVAMVTTGWNLTCEKVKRLWWDSGLDQLSVSLDFPDERHDEIRKLEGLYGRIEALLPKLSENGIDNVLLNTVIMNLNLDEIANLAKLAHNWGIKISYSCYTSMKTGDYTYYIEEEEMNKVEDLADELLELKREQGNIVNSDYYLSKIPQYFRTGKVEGCLAGERWLQITPDGYLKPCSEMPIVCHFSEYDGDMGEYNLGCSTCWFNCRGESQAPINRGKIIDLLKRW